MDNNTYTPTNSLRTGIAERPTYVYTIGVSCAEMRHKVAEYIVNVINPRVILDLACGVGAYALEIKERDKEITMIGLDGCIKYLTSVHALRYYNVRIHCMIEDYLEGLVSIPADLILWMDGPEHFEKDKATEILGRLYYVIISTPLFEYEQGVVEGNKLEMHRCSFTEKEINDLGYETLFKVKYDERGDIGAFTKGL